MQRVWDFSISAGLLAIALPLLAAIALAILLADGRPVIYRQRRIGRYGAPFTILKFRSMQTGCGGVEVTAGGDSRVTRIGRVLRRYKLDELPQLWNVLRGDMSLVGPRPEVPRYVDAADPVWKRVHLVRPGLTDLATLVYRDEETILAGFDDPERAYRESVLPAKLALNLEYLERRSPVRDLKLLMLTIRHSFWPGRFEACAVKQSILPRNS
jgi:lipopolysaccharide/colanic/teichoic acid biosynthesis glycosyltransferase